MNEDSASSAPLPAPTRSVAPTDGTTDGSRLALLVLLVGLALSAAGAVDGIVIWSKHEVVGCKPAYQGVGDCYTHPQAGLGIAITMVSLALASLMVLVCVLANNLLFALRRG